MLIDYLRRIHLNCEEAERMAHSISLRYKRRIGEQIVEMKEDGVIRRGKLNNVDIDDDDFDNKTVVKLSDLGITPDQSSDYQAMAAIPDPLIRRHSQSKASCVSAKRLAVKIYLLTSDYVSGITIISKTTTKS